MTEGDRRVALGQEGRQRTSHNVAAANDRDAGSFEVDPEVIEEFETTGWCAWSQRWKTEVEPPCIGRRDAVDILEGREVFENQVRVQVIRQRHQHQDTGNSRIRVQPLNHVNKLLASSCCRQLHVPVLDLDSIERAVDRRSVGERGAILPY